MTQVYKNTILDAVSENKFSDVMTHQDDFYHRSVYISGTFTADINILVSPDAEGDNWFAVVSESSPGVYACSVVCRRLRAEVASYADGEVTVKILSRAT